MRVVLFKKVLYLHYVIVDTDSNVQLRLHKTR